MYRAEVGSARATIGIRRGDEEWIVEVGGRSLYIIERSPFLGTLFVSASFVFKGQRQRYVTGVTGVRREPELDHPPLRIMK